MAKPLVLRTEDAARVPFLRGILTRSLQAAGLSFEDAYQVASDVRHDLRDVGEITTQELRKRVARRLAPHGEAVVHRYLTRHAVPRPVLVHDTDGHTTPFSRGRQRLALSPSGVTPEQAGQVVDRLLEHFAADGVTEITARDLGLLTYGLVKEAAGAEAARRYAVWQEYLRSDVPLLVLIGGVTGTGKSTIAAELSNRLEIVRAQSTDMLREVMRTMVPQRLLPVLHTSSFLAWQMLPHPEGAGDDGEDALVNGYLAQVELLSVACEAVLQRAMHERVSLIVEGVHVHPDLLQRIPRGDEAIVVAVMLAVLKPKKLRQQIKGRGQRIEGRRAKRYLQHFDAIWRLQGFLLSEADRAGVPIVANEDVDEAVHEVVGLVIAELSRHFSGKPSKAFR